MFGLCNELAGDNGFAWNMRLISMHGALTDPAADPYAKQVAPVLAAKYGYDPALLDAAKRQVALIISRLREQLARQEVLGRAYLIGNTLLVLDIYWATFAGAIDPLLPELCPNMPAAMRASYTNPT